MVNKAAIDRNLRELSVRYERRSRNPRDPLYFSKLALIELCGWIEETMDSIARDCARRHSTAEANLTQAAEEVIGRTYGFHYGGHFRNMLIVGNQQKWDTSRAERSGAGWRSCKLPESPVMPSSPFDCLSLHLPSAL